MRAGQHDQRLPEHAVTRYQIASIDLKISERQAQGPKAAGGYLAHLPDHRLIDHSMA